MFIALTKAANAYAVRLSAIFHHEAKMLGFKGHFCEAVNIASARERARSGESRKVLCSKTFCNIITLFSGDSILNVPINSVKRRFLLVNFKFLRVKKITTAVLLEKGGGIMYYKYNVYMKTRRFARTEEKF